MFHKLVNASEGPFRTSSWAAHETIFGLIHGMTVSLHERLTAGVNLTLLANNVHRGLATMVQTKAGDLFSPAF